MFSILRFKQSVGPQVGALALMLATSLSAYAQNIPVEGIYSGAITVANGPDVAMSLQINYTNIDVPSDPGDVLPFKKQLVGRFTIEDEAGPYSLAYIDYSIEQGFFDLYYVRSSSGSTTTTPGTGSTGGGTTPIPGSGTGSTGGGPPTNYSLYFQAKFAKNKITGVLHSSQRGDLGNFSLSLNPKQKTLSTTAHLAIGEYEGKLQNGPKTQTPIIINISANAGVTTNTTDLELDWSPARISTLLVDRIYPVSFSQVYLDYFTHTIRMVSVNTTSGGTYYLSGVYSGNKIDGVAAGSGTPASNYEVIRTP